MTRASGETREDRRRGSRPWTGVCFQEGDKSGFNLEFDVKDVPGVDGCDSLRALHL